MNRKQDHELPLDSRIAIAHSEFLCASGPGEKRVKWRTWSELVRRKQCDQSAVGAENTES